MAITATAAAGASHARVGCDKHDVPHIDAWRHRARLNLMDVGRRRRSRREGKDEGQRARQVHEARGGNLTRNSQAPIRDARRRRADIVEAEHKTSFAKSIPRMLVAMGFGDLGVEGPQCAATRVALAIAGAKTPTAAKYSSVVASRCGSGNAA